MTGAGSSPGWMLVDIEASWMKWDLAKDEGEAQKGTREEGDRGPKVGSSAEGRAQEGGTRTPSRSGLGHGTHRALMPQQPIPVLKQLSSSCKPSCKRWDQLLFQCPGSGPK